MPHGVTRWCPHHRPRAWSAAILIPMAISATRVVLPGLVREVGGILRRQWVVAMVPAALLGAGADVLVLLRHHLEAEIAIGIALALAFELYVGYAELVVAADRSDERRPGVMAIMRGAARVTPSLLIASAVAVILPLAATGLLVLPGLWLLTRWSLFAPAIVHERLGPRAALGRSADLVRGAFWAVVASVTASVLVEHAVIHGTAHAAVPALGSVPLGVVGAALATTAVSPPAAFTISVVYERLARVA